MKIFDSKTILSLRELLGHRDAGRRDDPQPLLELASNYGVFYFHMITGDTWI